MSPKRLAGLLDRRRFLIGAVLLWVVWLFAACLWGDQRLAFRDVSHFYLPLYGYLGERQATGTLPLWNPLDRFGVPVAGEATTAIFYLPRLLFSTGLPASRAMTLYVVGHLLLAGCGAYRAARWAGATPRASLAAAVAYPAAGPVFFLYTNPPFLVGAAWLPWALCGLLGVGRTPSLPALTVAAVALAMAVLGGDPQTAFHAVLFAAGHWAVLRFRAWRTPATAPSKPSLLPLGAAVLLAFGLSSLQILPGALWSLQSWRHHSQPVSVYGRMASRLVALPAEDAAPTPAQAAIGKHEAEVYDYSVAPWHWAELASPFVSGRLFPINGRLSQLIPGEPRSWTLTLYAGLLPFLCLLAGPLHPRRWTVWHALVAAGLLLALGDFGLARLVRSVLEPLGLMLPPGIPDAAGGGYWALVSFVPGYGQFRYPAKWLSFASLGMAIWMAVFLSRSDAPARRRAGRVAFAVGAAAAGLMAISWLPLVRTTLSRLAASANVADLFWGPLDVSAGLHSLRWSLVLTTVFAGLYWLLFAGLRFGRRPTAASVSGLPSPAGWAVALLAVELAFSTAWQLSTVPDESWPSSAPRAAQTRGDSAPPQRFLAAAAPTDWPLRWRTSSSADRLEEVEAAQRATWFIRWHLADSAAVVNSAVSIGSTRSTLFWHEARQFALSLNPRDRRAFTESLHRFVGLEAVMDRRIAAAPAPEDRSLLQLSGISDPLPLVRWHAAWRWTERPPATGREEASDLLAATSIPRARPAEISEQLRWQFGDLLRAPANVPPTIAGPSFAVAGSAQGREPSVAQPGTPRVSEVQLEQWQPERIRVRVAAATAGLVTVQQLQDGLWRARIRSAGSASSAASFSEWREFEVRSVDVIAQGVLVPPGRHQVEFYYRPAWLLPGLTLTTTAALLLIGCWLGPVLGRCRGCYRERCQSAASG